MPDPSASWVAAAAAFRPVPGWLAPGPRLFAPPDRRAQWAPFVRAVLRAHPELATDLEARAVPRPVAPSPAGFVDPRQWTGCLPAAALLALAADDPQRLAPVQGRVASALALPDWVPPHHAHSRPLDLSAAGTVGDLALYLDFARDLLPAGDRDAVAAAIVGRGALPLLAMCAQRSAPWTRARHNWPTVVAGQVGLGLLAAWDAVPAAEAPAVLAAVVERIAAPLLTYPADGSYEEGPAYWHYGLGECLPFCEALALASGGAASLLSLPFLAATGDYALHVRTPDGGCFDVEDGSRAWAAGWMLAVLGRRLGRPDWTAAAAETLGRPAGGPALWQVALLAPVPSALVPAPSGAPSLPAPSGAGAPPPMAHFPGTQNAMLRSDWSAGAFFVGLHAGSTTVNHAHLDLGTFTVVAAGQRLVADAGNWAYTLDYFQSRPDGRRWDYEPNTTAGHNALLVDGAGQEPRPEAECRFHQVDLRPEAGLALLSVDLAPAYGGRLLAWRRHFAFFAEGLLVVVDAAEADQPRRLEWRIHPAPGAAVARLADGVAGWRWQVGEAAAQWRLAGLSEEAGYVLAEETRQTTYRDRTGRRHTYATAALRVGPLHPADRWQVLSCLTAGPAVALPPAEVCLQAGRAEAGGAPEAAEVVTARRRGTLSWAGGALSWVGSARSPG